MYIFHLIFIVSCALKFLTADDLTHFGKILFHISPISYKKRQCEKFDVAHFWIFIKLDWHLQKFYPKFKERKRTWETQHEIILQKALTQQVVTMNTLGLILKESYIFFIIIERELEWHWQLPGWGTKPLQYFILSQQLQLNLFPHVEYWTVTAERKLSWPK